MRILLALALLATIPVHAADAVDEGARNVQILKHYIDLGEKGLYGEMAAMWSPDAQNNGRPMRPEMIRTILEDIYRTFPDYKSEIIEIVTRGDLVVYLSRVSGTHRGVSKTNFNGGLLQGAKPTGLRFESLQTHWYRLRDGKLIYHQGVRDDLSMMRQLGLVADELPADKRATP